MKLHVTAQSGPVILVIIIMFVCVCVCVKKNLKHLDLLSIPQSRGKMSKRLGGIIVFKDKTSSWHLNGFPDGR